MAVITFREALNQAIDEEMARDDTVFLMGEEVGEYNGAYKVSKGLMDRYGAGRVVDTPITELGFTGVGIGAAMAGLRPIVEWMTFNFGILALDQVINNAAKMRYMSGGQFTLPMVIRGPNGPAEYLSSQHSQALQSIFVHVPGLKVVAPSTPYDAKGLLKSAVRDDNPVIFMEAELMYGWKGEVPEEEYLVPIGEAEVKREGSDVTQETVYGSVRKTSRCVVVDEAWPTASLGSHVAWLVSRNCFDHLDAPVELVSSEDVPMPYNHTLELAVQPSVDKIVRAAKRVLYI